jgi:hypothetical protein
MNLLRYEWEWSAQRRFQLHVFTRIGPKNSRYRTGRAEFWLPGKRRRG